MSLKIIKERIKNSASGKKHFIIGGSILGGGFVIGLIIALVVNGAYHKADTKGWWDKVEAKTSRPWGTQRYCLNTKGLSEVDRKWSAIFKVQAAKINKDVAEMGGPENLIQANCSTSSQAEVTHVNVKPAPASFYDKRNGDQAFCRYQANTPDQLISFDEYGRLHPHINQGKASYFTLYVCHKKYEKTMTYHDSELKNELAKIGKDGIAQHELWHLFFHKHVAVGGGIISETPQGKNLGPGAVDIFKEKILKELGHR